MRKKFYTKVTPVHLADNIMIWTKIENPAGEYQTSIGPAGMNLPSAPSLSSAPSSSVLLYNRFLRWAWGSLHIAPSWRSVLWDIFLMTRT